MVDKNSPLPDILEYAVGAIARQDINTMAHALVYMSAQDQAGIMAELIFMVDKAANGSERAPIAATEFMPDVERSRALLRAVLSDDGEQVLAWGDGRLATLTTGMLGLIAALRVGR